jgi:hypothetical protein
LWSSRALTAMSALWCVVVGCWLWFTPVRYLETGGGRGRFVERAVYRSFAEISGFGVLPLIVPAVVAIAAAYAAWRGQRVLLGGLAALLAGFTVITGFSIGGAYLPAAGLLIVSALLVGLAPGPLREEASG